MHIKMMILILAMLGIITLLGLYFFDEIVNLFKPTLKSVLHEKIGKNWFNDYESSLYHITNHVSLTQKQTGELMAVHILLHDDELLDKKTYHCTTPELIKEYVFNIHELRDDINSTQKTQNIIVDSIRLNKFLTKQLVS